MSIFWRENKGKKAELELEQKISHFRAENPLLPTLGQKPAFYPEIPNNLMFEKCKFCEKRATKNVNFVKCEILKMCISS